MGSGQVRTLTHCVGVGTDQVVYTQCTHIHRTLSICIMHCAEHWRDLVSGDTCVPSQVVSGEVGPRRGMRPGQVRTHTHYVGACTGKAMYTICMHIHRTLPICIMHCAEYGECLSGNASVRGQVRHDRSGPNP